MTLDSVELLLFSLDYYVWLLLLMLVLVLGSVTLEIFGWLVPLLLVSFYRFLVIF